MATLVTGPNQNLQGVQIPDQVSNYARLLAIKQSMQEAPLRQQALQQQVQQGQQALQTGQLEMEQKQRALASQKAMDAAMQEWTQPKATASPAATPSTQTPPSGTTSAATTPAATTAPSATSSQPDWDDLLKIAQKQPGMSYEAYQGLLTHVQDMKAKAWETAKNQAQTGSDIANRTKTENQMRIDSLSGVAQLPDDQIGEGLQTSTQYLSSKGLIDPQQARQYLTTAQSGDPAAIRHLVTMQATSMGAYNKMLDDAIKTVELQQKQQQTQYGPTGDAAKAQYQSILKKVASGTATVDDILTARAYEATEAKGTTQSDTLGITSVNTSRPAGLASVLRPQSPASAPTTAAGIPAPIAGVSGPLPSSNLPSSSPMSPASVKANIVDMVGQYRYDPASLNRLVNKHPEVIAAVNAQYPDWNQTDYQAKNKMVQSYTSGPESRSINAIGTALGHANELRDAIDALGNGDAGLKTLRALGNKFGIEVGSDATTGFNLIVHRLAPEITAAYVQGGGGEGERIAAAEDFSPSLSRNQLIKNWSESVKLLQSKIAQDKQQWDTTYKPTRSQDDFYTRFMSPVAKQAVDRWSIETGNKSAIGGAAPAGTQAFTDNGVTYHIPTDKIADFKKDHPNAR